MDFISWLNSYLLKEKISKRYEMSEHGVKIWEKREEMEVSINGISEPYIIVCPALTASWEIFDPSNGWGRNCDFLILGISDRRMYALFIELKPSAPNSNAPEQLRWTRRVFYYFISMFNLHKSGGLSESDLITKYFVISEKHYNIFEKRTVRTDGEIHKKSDPYKDFVINYRVSDIYDLENMLNAD